MEQLMEELMEKAKQIRVTDKGVQLIFPNGEVIEVPNGSKFEILKKKRE